MYAYIASQRTDYPIGFMCRVLEVSTSGFFAWQARDVRDAAVRRVNQGRFLLLASLSYHRISSSSRCNK